MSIRSVIYLVLQRSRRYFKTKKKMTDVADDYFVSNIERVDSVTLLRKDKLLTGRDITWTLR